MEQCARLMAGSDPWINVGRTVEKAAAVFRDPAKEIHIVEDADGVAAVSPKVFLCVSSFNPEALRLYERLGYMAVGRLTGLIVTDHDGMAPHWCERGRRPDPGGPVRDRVSRGDGGL